MPTKDWIENRYDKYLIWRKKLVAARRNYIKNHPNFQDGPKNPMYKKCPWNKGKTKETDERVMKYSLTRKERIRNGEIIPCWKGKRHSEEHRRKNSLAKIGYKNPMKRKDVREKVSKSMKEKWKNDQDFARKILNSFRCLNKNKFEREFESFCKINKLPFIYVGNGSFWVGPCISGKRRNPDFKHLWKNKVVLLNGEYWHKKEDVYKQIKDYQSKRYDVFIIWQDEWKNSKENILNRINKFI